MIRPFVAFDYNLNQNLTPYAKRKIKKYFDEISALQARPNYVYRPRSKQRLDSAQRFAQQETALSELTVAFIPTYDDKPRITFNANRELILRTRHVTTHALTLDPARLAIDPLQHVNETIAAIPEANRFTVRAGRYEIPQSHARATLGRFVKFLTDKYNVENNHHYSHWLHGISAHTFTDQQDSRTYIRERNKARAKLKRARAAARRKAARKK